MAWTSERPCPPEVRARIAASLRGRSYGPQSPERRAASGTGQRLNNPEPSYHAMHKRMQADQPYRVCVFCSKTDGRIEAALKRETPEERLRRTARGLRYSVEVVDYMWLCVRCHRRYDRGLL